MQTLSLPSPPIFDTAEAERAHRKLQLAAAFRLFSKFGLEEGVTGHITARDPEFTDHLWVNPWGVPFSRITVSDLCLMDATGQLVEGPGPINPAAFAMRSVSSRPTRPLKPDSGVFRT